MRAKKEEKGVLSRGLHIRVTQTRDAKGSNVVKENDCMLVPTNVPIVLGIKEKNDHSSVKKKGTGIQSMVNVCQMASIHVIVSLKNSRELSIQV